MEELNKATVPYESDEALIEQFKNGDRESFNALVKRYQKQAVNYMYRLSRDFELAEDIAQTGFLTVYQKASLFRTGFKFRPWFYKILTNLYYGEMRKKKHVVQYSLDSSGGLSNGTAISSGEMLDILSAVKKARLPLDELEEKEKKTNIERLIASLPHKQKVALALYIYNELSYKEIASAMGCSVGTVKSRIHYALISLKEKIVQFNSGGGSNEVQTNI